MGLICWFIVTWIRGVVKFEIIIQLWTGREKRSAVLAVRARFKILNLIRLELISNNNYVKIMWKKWIDERMRSKWLSDRMKESVLPDYGDVNQQWGRYRLACTKSESSDVVDLAAGTQRGYMKPPQHVARWAAGNWLFQGVRSDWLENGICGCPKNQ
jgi:hypothetical protein